MVESEVSDSNDYGLEESSDSMLGMGYLQLDEDRIQTLVNFGYPDEYVRFCLQEMEASYCTAAYYLLGEDQNY